ncbi:NAD(+) synthase [Cerasicoccus arenae]|uniref:Glutamine-dependent NAD(+) synthetase n=1 Tax=Cerasicoccus arenae TaxID=424488 RepID=A0A8J3GDD6_9BACT|nr:NAD(+) synthase [Cerasicoccus arenae]MBK1857309.1 NAD(+) synthase [Cerasicoccus arenae]GHC00604.1 NAD(+) synthase [Cerasicoccus arenae]
MPTNPEDYGFLRVALVSPELRVADVPFNTQQILAAWKNAADSGARLIVFPELCLTGYSCADLFYDRTLRAAAWDALQDLRDASVDFPAAAVVGLPVATQSRLFNVAALIAGGQILGFVPKTHLPNYGEFYEQRWFSSATELMADTLDCDDEWIPIGTDLIFHIDGKPDYTLAIEICEDLWAVEPPSGKHALAGANVIVNPSASNELLGKADYRRSLVSQQSARSFTAYLYASAGPGESTTDVVYSGHCIAAENGHILAESERFNFETQSLTVDIDLEHMTQDRLRNSSFAESMAGRDYRLISVSIPEAPEPPPLPLQRRVPSLPFVPSDMVRRAERCREIFAIQATGLAKRLRHTGSKRIILGVSGGLDSTLALLAAVHAFDKLGLDRKGILSVTMPGFGTTGRTKNNATKLAEVLGTELRTISIEAASRQHFADIGHDEAVHDVVYENTQARERTQILMNLANKEGGFVLGTGDLSEAALGWCTYAGDHISMYHVNVGVPKTLVRYIVDWCADELFADVAQAILHDIADTPISPELLPLTDDGQLQQKTEETVGPYELHDFFLYQIVRFGYAPRKVLFLATQAFAETYDAATIKRWLATFYRRFFSQQFKRSCFPDGPKVGTVSLSPRGDWRMPSDASATIWLREVEAWEAPK